MRKKLLGVSLIIILLSLAAYGTWAYFTTDARTTNVITTGTVDISLVETTIDGEGNTVAFPQDGITGVMPGRSVDKRVSVVNNGTGESWIRATIVCRIVGADGSEMPLQLENGEDALIFDINEEKWEEQNGYYYYTGAVKVEASTEHLFTQVTFNKAMGNEYQNCTAYVDVAAQAVQVKNNGETVFDAAGWPAN